MNKLHTFLMVCLLPLSEQSSEQSCDDILEDVCIRKDFPRAIAHGTHSLNLQELLYYFDKSATENNSIKIVNFNLSSPDLVLPSAPDLKLDNTFVTPSMNSVDHILSNWENEDFFMKGASVTEMLVHNLHMYETLSEAGKIYGKLKKKVKKNNNGFKINLKKICECMKEEDEEISNLLEQMANYMRNSDDQTNSRKKRRAIAKPMAKVYNCYEGWRGQEYNKGCCYDKWYCDYELKMDEMEMAEGKYRNGPNCEKLVRSKQPVNSINHHAHGNSTAVPPLVDSASWKVWKSQLHVRDGQVWNYELATYIFCKLNKNM